MTKYYKFAFSHIKEMTDEYCGIIEQKGKPVMETLVHSTESILKTPYGYKKFGVYWYAIKAVLREFGTFHLDDYSVTWLENEYATALDGEPLTKEMVLVAGYEFAKRMDFIESPWVNDIPPDEYLIDDVYWSIAE